MEQSVAGKGGAVKLNMRKLTRVSLIAFLIQIALIAVVVAPALANSETYVSGSVFVDVNHDHMQQPSELVVPFATVHGQLKSDPSVTFAVQANATGDYVLAGLPYGMYDFWAGDGGLTSAFTLTAELSEVNSASTLDLPVYDNSADVELTNIKLMYLPIAVNQD